MITRTIYDFFLEKIALKPDENSLNKRQRIAVSQGPSGRADSYQLFAEDGQNAWHLAIHGQAKPRKMVIFADPILYLREKSSYEYELWDEVIKNYTVFLWQGSDIPFLNHTTVVNSESFWKEIKSVKPQTKREISARLADQGLNLDEYIIVDAEAYYEFLMSYKAINYSMDYNITIADVASTVSTNKISENLNASIRDAIKKLDLESNHKYLGKSQSAVFHDLMSAEEVKSAVEKHSRAEEMVFHETPMQDITQWLQCTSYLPSKLNIHVFYNPKGSVFPCVSIREVNLVFDDYETKLDLSNLRGCEKVSIIFKKNSYRMTLSNIKFPDNIKKISVDCSGCMNLDGQLKLPKSVESLKIRGKYNTTPDIADINAVNLPNLKKLSIRDCNKSLDLSGINIKKLSYGVTQSKGKIQNIPEHIQSLNIFTSAEYGNLNHLDNISELSLINVDKEKLPNKLNLSLRSLSLSFYQSNELDLSNFPNLVEIHLSSCINLVSLKNIPSTLKIIVINSLPNLTLLNLSDCPEMNMIELKNVPKVKVKWPKYVKHLHLSETNTNMVEKQRGNSDYNYLSDYKIPSEYSITHDLSSIQKCYSLELNEIVNLSSVNFPRDVNSILINGCDSLKNIDVGEIGNLSSLVVTKCSNLSTVGKLPETLEGLTLDKNTNLEPQDIEHLTQLRKPAIIKNIENIVHATSTVGDAPIFNDYWLSDDNDHNPTALLDFCRTQSPDSLTGGPPAKKDFSRQPMKVTLYTRDGVTKDDYRVHVLDTIKLSGNKLTFEAALDDLIMVNAHIRPYLGEETTVALKRQADLQNGRVAGDMEAELLPGMRVPLTTLHALPDMNCLECYTNNKDLNFYWCESTKQCFIELKKSAQKQTVKLAYTYHTDAPYFFQPKVSGSFELPKLQKLLDNDLRKALDSAIASTPDLATFMWDENLTILEKIEHIANYCKSFRNERASVPADASSLDILIHNLTHQRGVCRHRAQSFMVLVQYLGVRATINSNENHAFVEFPLNEDGVMAIRAFELGGGESLDLTPSEKRGVNPFEHVRSSKPDKTSPENEPVKLVDQFPPTIKTAKLFTNLKMFKSIQPFLALNSPRAPLITLTRGIYHSPLNLRILQ